MLSGWPARADASVFSRVRLCGDAEPVTEAEHLVEDRHWNGERLGRRYVVEMRGDVVGGRVAARLRKPTRGESDEDPREAPGACRVVVMGQLTGPTGEENHDRHDQLGLDGVQKSRPLEVLLVGYSVGDHPRVAEGEHGIG